MTTIKLDIDGDKKLFKAVVKRIKIVVFTLRFFPTIMTVHKTKNGYHIYLEIEKNLTDREICLVQCLCGSDLYRELCNYKRIKARHKNWNVLFSVKKGLNGKEKSKERYLYSCVLNFN